MSELSDEELRENEEAIGRVVRRSAAAAAIVAAIVAGVVFVTSRPSTPETQEAAEVKLPEKREQAAVEVPELTFTDVTAAAGIDFVHDNRLTGDKLLPETMGGGCAFLDYDNDGDQDILLVDSNRWPSEPARPDEPSLRLYANDGAGKFADVTQEAGIRLSCYGMGLAVGDYDNDGDEDVFVTAVGANALLRNDDGKFVDATDEAGVAGAEDAWSTGAALFDYDNDGDLDLFVGNYVTWSPEIDIVQDFRLTGVGRAYGPPLSFTGSFPYFYRNDGEAGFTEISAEAGFRLAAVASDAGLAKTLGVRPCDVDNDGWMDLLVANDTVRNLLFVNNHDGTFREAGVEAGIAYDMNGMARGAMGIDAAAFRGGGDLAVAVGNFANEMSAFYVSSDGGGFFTDEAIPIGIGPQTRLDLSFGLFFFDADLDGRLDLFTANGHIENEINRVQASQHYRQPAALFWNAGASPGGEFVRITDAGELTKPLVGRGAAYADIDADGDLDVLVTQIAGPPALLRNDSPATGHFIRLKLVGTQCNRDAVGARVVATVDGKQREACVAPTRSYLSQVELPVTIGLGDHTHVDSVTVTWPGGGEQSVADVTIDGLTTVQQAPAP